MEDQVNMSMLRKTPYLTIAFVLVSIYNYARGETFLLGMPYTYGVFLPLNIIQVGVLAVTYIRQKRFYWWRNPGMLIYIALAVFLQWYGSR